MNHSLIYNEAKHEVKSVYDFDLSIYHGRKLIGNVWQLECGRYAAEPCDGRRWRVFGTTGGAMRYIVRGRA